MKANGKLMAFRKDRGWSQFEMARVLSVDSSYISKLEKGQQKPSISLSWKIIDLFDKYNEDILLSELITGGRDD